MLINSSWTSWTDWMLLGLLEQSFFLVPLLFLHIFICGKMTPWALRVIRLAWPIAPFFIWLNCDLELFTALMRSMLCCPAEMFLSKTLKLFSAHAVLLLILPSDLQREAYENKFSLQGAIYTSSKSTLHSITWQAPFVRMWCLRCHWDSERHSVWLTFELI